MAARGRSLVIITSRTSEEWLGGVRRLAVGGLAAHDAAEYASDLLAPYPAAQSRRTKRAFGELMTWLDGHPLSMRLILPHLETTEPEVLLDSLHGTAPLPGSESIEAGRMTPLAASLASSSALLNDGTRRLLPAVSLFQGVADVDVLALFSEAPAVPERFRGKSRAEWGEALDEAARVGLLTSLGGGMYRIHPALPAYLAAEWRSESPTGHESVRDDATHALLSAFASFGAWLYQQISSGDAGLAYAIIGLQRLTFGSLLGYALDHQLWEPAQGLVQPLDAFWTARGLTEEADMWADRVRLATESPDGSPPLLGTPAGDLWLVSRSSQVGRYRRALHLDEAERTLRQIMAMLQSQPGSPQQQRNLATTYQQLADIARDRGRLDDADDMYRRSLAISEDLGNRPGMASTYHQLGNLATLRGWPDDAEDWYRRSLAIDEELGNRPGRAGTYHQLGNLAQHRQRLDDADDWYRRALAIDENHGDRHGMAISYHQLGMLAQQRGRLDDAENWYARSLAISEELGSRPDMADTYHQLGMLAQQRGRLDDAENWYARSVAIKEEIGNRPGMADTYHQLGNIAYLRGRLSDAEDWYSKSVALRKELGDRSGMSASYLQLGIVAQDQGRLDDAERWYRDCLATGEEVGERPLIASAFGQLGQLAEKRGQLHQALEWTIAGVALFEEFPDPTASPGPGQLARLTARLGIDATTATWESVTHTALPDAVRDYITKPFHGETGSAIDQSPSTKNGG